MHRQDSLTKERLVLGLLLLHEGVVQDVGELVIEWLGGNVDHPSVLWVAAPLGPEGSLILKTGEKRGSQG